MRRRDFIQLAGTLAAWPTFARAQSTATPPVIGFLNPRSPAKADYVVRAFLKGLEAAGYAEGRNVVVDYRWGEDQSDRLPSLAADLVRRNVTVIVAGSTPSARAAMAATQTIPIVFTTAGDPVQLGLVASLGRPGGNVTGATFYSTLLVAKQMELIHELVPAVGAIAVLVNPRGLAAQPTMADAEIAAKTLGRSLHTLNASTVGDIDKAFAALGELPIAALLVGVDPLFDSRPEYLVALAAKTRVPTVYNLREFVAAGGLVSYGGSITGTYRQAGAYAGRILGGTRPADLPVIQPTTFDLVVNQKTAKALGLTIPESIMVRADEVIE